MNRKKITIVLTEQELTCLEWAMANTKTTKAEVAMTLATAGDVSRKLRAAWDSQTKLYTKRDA